MITNADSSRPQNNPSSEAVTDHEAVNRSLRLMAKKFSKPIQIKDLVELSNLSRRGFHKAFCKSVGCCPGVYLRNMRIKYAKQLLTEQDMSLKDIALRCGFRSTNTFWVAFTRMTKVAPKKYQRTHRLMATKNRHCGGEAPQTRRLNLAITSLS